MSVLQTVAQATIAADGTATARIQNGSAGQNWTVNYTTVQSTSVALTTATLYRGIAITPSNVLDIAYLSGNQDQTDTVLTLRPGEALTCQWTQGTPGALCTVSVMGEAVP